MTKDLSKKTKTDLQKSIAELRSRGQELNFKLAANQVRHVREIREGKKEIARLMTALKTAKE
ncbi:MAG: 50S ribosomal protein L29 [Patescibacteria group bacterium]